LNTSYCTGHREREQGETATEAGAAARREASDGERRRRLVGSRKKDVWAVVAVVGFISWADFWAGFFSFFFSFSFYLFLSLALLRCLLILLLLTREAQLIILKKIKKVVGKIRAATG
jgi:hypothetical protein